MIDYHPHAWTNHLFAVRGTMVREISGRVSACFFWAVAVVLFHHLVRDVHVSSTTHSLVGLALGLRPIS